MARTPTTLPSSESSPRVPRPPNPFLIYRSDLAKQLKSSSDGFQDQRNLSRFAGKRWRDEPPNVKAKYIQRATKAKAEHERLYPDYKYAPRNTVKPRPKHASSASTSGSWKGKKTGQAPGLEFEKSVGTELDLSKRSDAGYTADEKGKGGREQVGHEDVESGSEFDVEKDCEFAGMMDIDETMYDFDDAYYYADHWSGGLDEPEESYQVVDRALRTMFGVGGVADRRATHMPNEG